MLRSVLVIVVLLAGLGSGTSHGQAPAYTSDIAVLSAAPAGSGPNAATLLSWFRAQGAVGSAVLGSDGQTVDVRFKDGVRGAILPRSPHAIRVPASHMGFQPRLRPLQAVGGRALVLEPFATEIGLGPNAGDVEVTDLRAAGFQVDQAYDTQVTVATMLTLTRYNVVYMHTHSGVDRAGNGVVMTGQLATGDPSLQPYIDDGTVILSKVAGSTAAYYGFSSRFVTGHMGQFPRNSFQFINGCALRNTNFGSALTSHGAAALVSWDNEVIAADGYFSGAGFFYYMGKGQSIASAVASTVAAGAGTSIYNGQTATLGYTGDGTITLAVAASGTPQQTTPTSVPTVAPPPTSVPTVAATATSPALATGTSVPSTSTPTPTATATLAPAAPLKFSLKQSVKPGARQTIRLLEFAPTSSVHVVVKYPNGDQTVRDVPTDGAGTGRFVFVQPASKITRESSIAIVTIQMGTAPLQVSATDQYRIQFGTIDVSAEPRRQTPGQTVTVWVHTHPGSRVRVVTTLSKLKPLSGITGAGGWAHVVLKLPPGAAAGRKVVVRAETVLHGKRIHSATTFVVK